MSVSPLHRSQFGPLLYGLVAYAILLGAWQALAAPRLPSALHRIGSRAQNMVWVKPGISIFASEKNLEEARLLLVGDSRLWRAACPEIFDAQGLGPSAILWGSGARTKEILVAVSMYEPEYIVLAISTLSFLQTSDDEVKQVFTEVELPRWDADDFEQQVSTWRSSKIASLEAKGIPPRRYSYTLRTIEEVLRDQRTVGSLAPAGIDLRLARWASETRERAFRTIDTSTWAESWLPRLAPKRSQGFYRDVLKGVPLADSHLNMTAAARLLRALSERGIKIVCVRLPMDSGLRQIENNYLPPADYRRFCKAAGVRYLDYSKAPFLTYDGSHLTRSSATAFSTRLARKLKRDLRW